MATETFEQKARAAGWRTTDFGNYLQCAIPLDQLKESVSHYNDGHAFLERCEGEWLWACRVSGLEE